MGKRLLRFRYDGDLGWGLLHDNGVRVLDASGDTLAEVLGAAAEDRTSSELLDLSSLELMSPVTRDADFICQATNYRSHLVEIGRNPDNVAFNVFFHKASSSICGPTDDIIRPAHVLLLDYELELALVVGRPITGPIDATEETLGDWICGLVITNDVSARDVQISHEQFNKSKSYRTFGPTGPWLWLTEGDELTRWKELRLTLSVNGEERQNSLASDMVFGPVETLNELSRIRDLEPGDMIATGTPSGVALTLPSKEVLAASRTASPAERYAMFLESQKTVAEYLNAGDVIEASIRTDDSTIDLGTQRNRIVET